MADISGYLNTIANAESGETVRDAIIRCMRDINADAAVKQRSLLITKADNVTYTAKPGEAFKNVTINIDGSGESDPEKTVTYDDFIVYKGMEVGEYPAEEGHAYRSVKLEDDLWDSVYSDSILGEEATIGPGEIQDPQDGTGRRYWDALNAGYDYVKRIWIPSSVDIPDYPGGGGAGGGVGKITVNFYEDTSGTKLLQSVTCNAGDTPCLYLTKKPTPPSGSGKMFVRWSPDEANRACFSNISKATPIFEYIEQVGGDIEATWDEIFECRGTKWKNGATKTYSPTIPIVLTEDLHIKSEVVKTVGGSGGEDVYYEIVIPAGTYASPGALTFMKVADGGKEATDGGSSWLSINPLTIPEPSLNNIFLGARHWGINDEYGSSGHATCENILHGPFMKFLNKFIYKSFDDRFKKHIATGLKRSSLVNTITLEQNQYWIDGGINEAVFSLVNSSESNLWIPSAANFQSWLDNGVKDTGGMVDQKWYNEGWDGTHTVNHATDYSSVWKPMNKVEGKVIYTSSIGGWSNNYGYAQPMMKTFELHYDEDDNISPSLVHCQATEYAGNLPALDFGGHIYIGFCL